jgi:hypothetical protein
MLNNFGGLDAIVNWPPPVGQAMTFVVVAARRCS